MITKKITDIAISYLGEHEKKNNGGFINANFEAKMKQRGFNIGYAWCALFAELVWFESYEGTIFENAINRLFSASAVQTWRNFAKDKTFVCGQEPVNGAVVIWQYYKKGKATWQGHAGIVISHNEFGFIAVEGNTNSSGGREGIEVAQKVRDFSKPVTGLRLRGFIHPLEI
jgi:hypothetical protein